MPLPALAGVALRHGLGGLAFGVAIPATLGGAVKMNAGAHEGEMADVVAAIEVYRLRSHLERSTIPAAAAGFSYRRSDLPDDRRDPVPRCACDWRSACAHPRRDGRG